MFDNLKKLYRATDKKIVYLLTALVLFVITDGLLTQYLVPSGYFKEWNTFMEPLVGQPVFLVLKIVGAVLCAVLLWDVNRRFPRLGLIATWIAVIGCFAIVLWNFSLMLLI